MEHPKWCSGDEEEAVRRGRLQWRVDVMKMCLLFPAASGGDEDVEGNPVEERQIRGMTTARGIMARGKKEGGREMQYRDRKPRLRWWELEFTIGCLAFFPSHVRRDCSELDATGMKDPMSHPLGTY
ncbi:hypothetical protein ACLOJK_009988 [Asimina triloba]